MCTFVGFLTFFPSVIFSPTSSELCLVISQAESAATTPDIGCPEYTYRRTANHRSTVIIVAIPSYPTNTPPPPNNYVQLLQYLGVLRYVVQAVEHRPSRCATWQLMAYKAT